MKTVFLGNHTCGKLVLATLLELTDIAGVVAHPDDQEDGVRYESVHSYALQNNLPLVRGAGTDESVYKFIEEAKPDLIWITDYRYLLPTSVLALPHLGAINLHPSLLPQYRGRASINWAILNGEKFLGLTAHYVDAGMDTGDIVMQRSISLSVEEDVSDALIKLYPLYDLLTRDVLASLLNGTLHRVPQDHSKSSSYPARKPHHGRIDWHMSAYQIHNLVRAVAPPYPGAFTYLDGEQIYIYKAVPSFLHSCFSPGTIIEISDDGLLVACGTNCLLLKTIQYSKSLSCQLKVGAQLS